MSELVAVVSAPTRYSTCGSRECYQAGTTLLTSLYNRPRIVLLLPSPLDRVLMYRPAGPLPDIGFGCANEEIFICLEKMAHGSPLPRNVIADVNPYIYAPSNLPDGIWFLIRSKENEPTELGFWKVKEEACKLFSNSLISGWRITLEFFEGQVPYELKTDWMMQEYWITQKGLSENGKVKEGCSLCRVFLGGEQGLDHQKQQKMPSLHIAGETLVHSTQLVVPEAHYVTNSGSTSELAVKDDETGNLALTGEPANYLVEIPPDNDYFSKGDYLELLDLDDPASPSSSSDNSSCVTMSSDECFDSLALLKELDSEINQVLVQKDENCKLSISTSFRPNEVVMAPASPGSFVSIKALSEEVLKTDSSLPGLADHRDAGPSTSHDVGTSCSLHLVPRDQKRGTAKGRKKKPKNKYLCFMPFYFLL